MAALGKSLASRTAVIPSLEIGVNRAEAARYVAVPSVRFVLGIEEVTLRPIRSVVLDVQIQIAARQRGYAQAEVDLLAELFGAPERWGTTLRTLPWTRLTLVVAPFEGAVEIDLLVPCSYDLEVAGARYLAALGDGVVPLEFLFSGSVFYSGDHGTLQTARLPSDSEAPFALPVSVWREAMDRHFPGSAWLRLGRDQFQALCAYRARHAHTTWDATIAALLEARKPDER